MTLKTQSIDDFDCTIPVALANGSWEMGNQTVEYCLSETVPDHCRLQFSVPIMIAVIICNFIKLICITLTIWKSDFTLVTLGDAISSFLETPDPASKGMCTATKKEIQDGWWPVSNRPRRWLNKRTFWYEAVGFQRWLWSNVL